MENTEEIKIDYENVMISESEIIQFLGYSDTSVPKPVMDEIEEVLTLTPGYANIKAGYRYFKDENPEMGEDSFKLRGIVFNTDRIIASQLKDSTGLAFIISTAGSELPDLSSDLLNRGEYLKGYMVDSIGSLLAEKAADFIEKKIQRIASESGRNITNRLSPGYCGWNVSEQHKLFSLLPDGFCGVRLTESSLMVPIKSISAVIGIGESIVKGRYPCYDCTREDCFRKRNLSKI